MLAFLRTPRWRRRAMWFRGIGLALLLGAFFLQLPSVLVLAVTVPGLILFLLGTLAWLVREEEPWLRSR